MNDGVSLVGSARDALAVLDAVGSSRATLLVDTTVAVAITLVTMAPERVDRLVLINGYARIMTTEDYPHGHAPEVIRAFLDTNIDPDTNGRKTAPTTAR